MFNLYSNNNDYIKFGYHDFVPICSRLEELLSNESYSAQRRLSLDETDDSYIFTLELPGYKQSHLDVELEGDVLTVRAKREGAEFERAVKIPQDVDADKVEAKLEDGILTITLGKIATAKPRKIQIKT